MSRLVCTLHSCFPNSHFKFPLVQRMVMISLCSLVLLLPMQWDSSIRFANLPTMQRAITNLSWQPATFIVFAISWDSEHTLVTAHFQETNSVDGTLTRLRSLIQEFHCCFRLSPIQLFLSRVHEPQLLTTILSVFVLSSPLLDLKGSTNRCILRNVWSSGLLEANPNDSSAGSSSSRCRSS